MLNKKILVALPVTAVKNRRIFVRPFSLVGEEWNEGENNA